MRLVSHRKTFQLRSGDAALIEPQAWHYETYVRPSVSYRSFWLTAQPELPGIILTNYQNGVLGVDFSKHLPGLAGLFPTFGNIRDELSSRLPHWQMKVTLLLSNCLIEVDRQILAEDQSVRRPHTEPLQRLAHLARVRFREPLQLHHLAREVGCSPDHLGRQFHAFYHVTFRQFLTSLRLQHARQLLGEGRSIKESAADSGFEDVYYFTKVFKKFFHITPGRFMRTVNAQQSRNAE